MQHREQTQCERQDADRNDRIALSRVGRIQHHRRQQRRPRPQDQHGPPVPVPEVHEAMMQMLLVGRGEALAADRAAQDRPKRVENRHAEDHQRDEDRREEEERLAGELCAGSATDAHRRCRHQQAEQQRPTVAHEDPRRVHIVGKEPDAHPERDHGPEAAGIGGIEHRFIAEPERIQQEGRRSDGHDARREAVETIDQIDDVRHADHPDDRDEE